MPSLQQRLVELNKTFESGAPPYNAPHEAIEDITDAQVVEEIRYLDQERREIGRNENDDTVLAICASLLIIVLGIVA